MKRVRFYGKHEISNSEFELPNVIEAIKSNDLQQQLHGAIGLRKILTLKNPPIQAVIDANILPRLIEFLNGNADFQVVSLFCL